MVRIIAWIFATAWAGCLALSAQRLPPASWGGEGARLEISESTQEIEFACAHATIADPIAPDAAGRFDVKGTYASERPGPQREADSRPEPARFEGRVQDQTMTLTITLPEKKAAVGTYILTRGKGVRIVKCK